MMSISMRAARQPRVVASFLAASRTSLCSLPMARASPVPSTSAHQLFPWPAPEESPALVGIRRSFPTTETGQVAPHAYQAGRRCNVAGHAPHSARRRVVFLGILHRTCTTAREGRNLLGEPRRAGPMVPPPVFPGSPAGVESAGEVLLLRRHPQPLAGQDHPGVEGVEPLDAVDHR